jgi:C-terminal processing protease CtpA/Prc
MSINSVDMKGFIERATGLVGGLPHYKKQVATVLLAYFLFLNNVTSPFTINYLDRSKQPGQAVIPEGVDFPTSLSMASPNSNRPAFSFKVVNSKLGYIDFVAMSGNYQKFDAFLDSSFKVMRNNQINTLAIDLRRNSGGNSLLADLLLSYITKKDFSLAGGRNWKVSQQYKDYLKARGDTTNKYLQQKVGKVWNIGECGPHKPMFNVDTVFTGKVYFLTGPFTFSSANMMADAAKQYNLGTIVGDSTGESTNDFGEVYVMELPNTKIKVQATTAYDIGVDCNKKHNLPVIPDVVIKASISDQLNNYDPILAYIINNMK